MNLIAPKPVIDLLNNYEAGWQDYEGKLEQIPIKCRASGQTIVHDGKLFVTYEGWDWEQSLRICGTKNLKVVFETDLLCGPGVKLYEKIDVDQPGYVILRSCVEYFYIEWV